MDDSVTESFAVRDSAELVRVRHVVRRWAIELGFTLVEQTKIVTAASELARNMVDYGGGGELHVEVVDNGTRKGLKLTFQDNGPGMENIADAMRDGYTTGSGLGLGLGGAKRLSNEFAITSAPGAGTTVTIIRWRGAA